MRVASVLGLLAGVATAAPMARSTTTYTRAYLASVVTEVLDSMVAHNPYTLPLASLYKATENSHPAALSFMTSWRTIVYAGPPSLLALDTTQGAAYFALDVDEGNLYNQTVLRGRIQLNGTEISEIELFLNRGRGDHGFSYGALELASNYEVLMNPPANRTNPTRETLLELSQALFAESSNFTVTLGDDCQFTELGWSVVDTGTWANGSSTALGCTWPSSHPTDDNARVGLVIDEELGFVVTSGAVQGTVFPYANISAFIPNKMTAAQEVQYEYIDAVNGEYPLVEPFGATGDTLEVLQWYDDALQAMQINVYLNGPNMTSPWV